MIKEDIQNITADITDLLTQIVSGKTKVICSSAGVEIKVYKVGSNVTRIDIVEKK